MTPERWNRIALLFAAVADLPRRDRTKRLGESCNGDPQLRRDVELLLEADRAVRDGWSISKAVARTLREFLE